MKPHGALIRHLRVAAARSDPKAPKTLVAFAAAAGVNPGQLSRIERGTRTRASWGWLLKVADQLGVSVHAIATDDAQ